MSLKQSIVIVNEYTIKNGKSSGSRGGTPGDYVKRYMARDRATEDVTPVRLSDAESYIQRYMARKEASESLDSVPKIKRKMRDAQKQGGVAFGYGDVSLSDERLQEVSKDIQHQFDIGKTVLKTVLSFDEEYLREHGLLEPDFVCKNKGDFRGHIDQMKLRMAIMNGLDRMGRDYDDLQYVGVIQVDTTHLHCHLAMVDRGEGHLMKDGTQRGRITEHSKMQLRRGIDMWLDQKQTVKMMSSSVMHDKRNALCYIKKFTHKTMAEQGLPQFLISCLPDNRNWWRASTNRKEMRKANAIVREYVLGLLEEPNSGYAEAVRDMTAYADSRQNREGLSELDRNRLIRDGQERLIQDCMNGVYSVLKTIPRSAMVVRTPMLDTMSMDYEDMAAQAAYDPMVEFGFKLRSYSTRLKHHRKEYHKYKREREAYEEAEEKSEDSKALGDFFREEENYNAMLMVKYQYFLSFLPPDENVQQEFEDLMTLKKKYLNLQNMKEDPTFQRLSEERAEEYGLDVYGQSGGRHVKVLPQVIDARLERMDRLVQREEQAFRTHLQDYGLDYDGKGVIQKKRYPFADVKALDLHHMGYDFPYDMQISKLNVDRFQEQANRRYDAFQRAKEYLVRSGQTEALKVLPEKDIVFMKQYADKLTDQTELRTERPEDGRKHRGPTVRLGRNYLRDMKTVVESTIRAAQLGED